MCPSGRTLARGGPASGSAPDLRSAFEVLDADRDGRISKDDLRAFYGAGGDDAVIGTMMSVADANEDGFVEYEEFERVLENGGNGRRKVGPAGVLEEVFGVMDKDGDGKLSHADLKGFMSHAGFAASDDDISAMIRLAGNSDAKGDGFVSFDDLVRILAL